MTKGILAQASARLPVNMGGSGGAIRNVPASFQGGKGTSLGVYEPSGGGGGGFGGVKIKLGKKQPPKGLVDDWKKTIEQLKQNVAKGLISPEQAKAIEAKLKPLYEELGENYGQPHKYSQQLRDAISKYGNVRDGVDYETVKAMQANPVNLISGAPNPSHGSNYETPAQVQQAREDAKQQALASGDWSRAEQLGATQSEIIARGGVLAGTEVIQEGPETYTVNRWENDTSANQYQNAFDEASGDLYDDFQTDSGFDTASFSDYQSDKDTSYTDPWSGSDYVGGAGYTDDGIYGTGVDNDFGVGTFNPDTGSGGFNRGGYIDYRGSGGMPAQYNNPNFPGKPRGTDTVPMYAEEGEFVMTREATDKFRPQLEAMNNHKPPSGSIDGAMSELDDLINRYAQRRQQ